MTKELAQQWVDALRSGKYFQGRGRLIDAIGGHCCLAVLGCVLNFQIRGDGYQFETTTGNDGAASYPVLSSFGLDRATQNAFIRMNDNEHRSFNEIADHIEATYINV